MGYKHKINKAKQIWKNHGIAKFIYHSLRGLIGKISFGFIVLPSIIVEKIEKKVTDIINDQFHHIHPIRSYIVPNSKWRFNLVLYSLLKEEFFGGVATSLILATLYANKYDTPLRIITRASPALPNNYYAFLKLMNIPKPEKVEFFSDYDRFPNYGTQRMEISEHDIFLSTSWWTSQTVKSINLRKSFFYILQEVELFFYPNGDEHLMCESILKDQNIKYLINSKLLYDYYQQSIYDNVKKNSMYFEPAFSDKIYFPDEKSFQHKKRRKLFFYARPNSKRNLYYSGLKFLDEAIMKGVIDYKEWEIHFGGIDITSESFLFSNGHKPNMLGQMDWSQYAQFLRSVDLAFSLMYTPHPSYIPLDVAASGGVVLTNKYLNKQSLNYSKNIICADLESESMLEGFKQAVELSKNTSQRSSNFLNNHIEKNWDSAFAETLNFMYENK